MLSKKEEVLSIKDKLQDVTHILPVDHSALKFSAYLVDLLKAKGNNTKSINNAMNKLESRNIFNSISEIKIQNAIVKKIEDIEQFIKRVINFTMTKMML